MDLPETIRQNVYQGLVLGDSGQWVPIAQMVAKEREMLNHLRRGRVIVDGQWVSIETARKASAQSQ